MKDIGRIVGHAKKNQAVRRDLGDQHADHGAEDVEFAEPKGRRADEGRRERRQQDVKARERVSNSLFVGEYDAGMLAAKPQRIKPSARVRRTFTPASRAASALPPTALTWRPNTLFSSRTQAPR